MYNYMHAQWLLFWVHAYWPALTRTHAVTCAPTVLSCQVHHCMHILTPTLTHLLCVFQVGNYTTDQTYWGRPEDYHLDRPYYLAGGTTGATNLAATMASALAATATVWKSSDTAYYTTLMTSAVELYVYATQILNPYGAIVSHLASLFVT